MIIMIINIVMIIMISVIVMVITIITLTLTLDRAYIMAIIFQTRSINQLDYKLNTNSLAKWSVAIIIIISIIIKIHLSVKIVGGHLSKCGTQTRLV